MLLVDRQALSEHTTTSSSTKSLGQALRVSLVKPGAYLSESYEIFPIGNFLAGEADAPQSVIRGTEQRLRGQGVRLIESQEAHHNGPCSFAAELLIDNRPAKHHQWLQVAQLQSTRPTAHDNLAQDRICLLEMGDSFSVG
jgi:hypothetical protein